MGSKYFWKMRVPLSPNKRSKNNTRLFLFSIDK